MDPKAFQELFTYNYWAFERVWACIEQLTDEQFTQEVDYSRGSIRNQVVHLMGTTQRWVARLKKVEVPARLVNEDFPTRAVAKFRWDELRAETMSFINSLTPAQLDETVHWEIADRGAAENHAWEILLHSANHGTDHRAQMLAILNQHFGIQTVEQDLILYLLEQQKNPA